MTIRQVRVKPTPRAIEDEINRLGAVRQDPNTGQLLKEWIAGALFTLYWAKGEPGALSPWVGTQLYGKPIAPPTPEGT